MATNSSEYNWISVGSTTYVLPLCVCQCTYFPRIIQAFEQIATSFVQQDGLKSLDITCNQTRFVAEKVAFDIISKTST